MLDAVHIIYFKVCFLDSKSGDNFLLHSHLITHCTHDPLPGGRKSFFASQTLVFAAQENLIIDSVIGLWEFVMLPFWPFDEISV